ncbi:YHS domain-containing protein [Streptomyces sp. NPDC059525]|uniref:YHS domain-containing protein n=1 Tax=Streptomyces sp. NPDC059525 TaxID=3346857 RepID=UPI00368702FE
MALSSLSVVTNASRLRRWHTSPLPEATAEHVEPQVESAADRRPAGTPAAAHGPHHHAEPAAGEEPRLCTKEGTVDPVCGMHVDPATAPERRDADTNSYFFCSPQCAAAFDAAPDRYLTHSREQDNRSDRGRRSHPTEAAPQLLLEALPLAHRQGKPLVTGVRVVCWSPVVARWKHPLPFASQRPHAYQRRPRPNLPPLPLQSPQQHQLGARCPPDHRPSARHPELRRRRPHPRTTVRRGGFVTQDAAEQALGRLLEDGAP